MQQRSGLPDQAALAPRWSAFRPAIGRPLGRHGPWAVAHRPAPGLGPGRGPACAESRALPRLSLCRVFGLAEVRHRHAAPSDPRCGDLRRRRALSSSDGHWRTQSRHRLASKRPRTAGFRPKTSPVEVSHTAISTLKTPPAPTLPKPLVQSTL